MYWRSTLRPLVDQDEVSIFASDETSHYNSDCDQQKDQEAVTAGYSKRSLVDKLGLKPGMRAALIHAPDGYRELLGPLSANVTLLDRPEGPCDFVHAFYTDADRLSAEFAALKAALAQTGMVWISWPKGASGVPTTLNENVVRAVGLEQGLVDVKVAAVDATWSGLKFVYRLRDRS